MSNSTRAPNPRPPPGNNTLRNQNKTFAAAPQSNGANPNEKNKPEAQSPTIVITSAPPSTNNNNRSAKNSSRCYTINNNQLNLGQNVEEERKSTMPSASVTSIINMFSNGDNQQKIPIQVLSPNNKLPVIPQRVDAEQKRKTCKRLISEEEAMSRLSGSSDFLKQRISSRRSNMQGSTTESSPFANNNNDVQNAQQEEGGENNEQPSEWWRQETTFFEYINEDGTPFEPDGTRVRALWDFIAEKVSDLSFNKGDIITILRRFSNGWWEGELNGFIGDFPCNFVEELDNGVDEEEEFQPSGYNRSGTILNADPQNPSNPKFSFSILQPIKQGFLTKKGQKRRNWKVRYFILEHGKISYYVSPADYGQRKALCCVPLLKSTVIKLAPEMKKSNCFAILSVRKPYTLYITAPTGEEMVSWMDSIESARGDGLL